MRYVEPFLGAGALFFGCDPAKAHLSDLNGPLIDFYKVLKEEPVQLHNAVNDLIALHCHDWYYAVRENYNAGGDSVQQASRFMYLNLTCFNGVFRVNREGKYNVPLGKRTRHDWPDLEAFLSASNALKTASLKCQDFSCSLEDASSSDFFFIDPPYPALSEIKNFQHYTLERFPVEAQLRLAAAVDMVDKVGAQFLMTNADAPLIRDLYSRFYITEHSVPRYVSCKKNKPGARELLISNYERHD